MTAGAALAPQTKFEGRLEDYAELRSWGLTAARPPSGWA